MKFAKKELIYVFMAIVTAIILLLIILEIPKIQRDLQQNVEDEMVLTISSIIDNFQDELRTIAAEHPGKTISEILKEDPAARLELEKQLSLLIAKDIKYGYVLFRDHNNKFRFMLDGALRDKVEFGRKFDIDDSAWERAYRTRQPQLIKHQKIRSLWTTYLKPIVINNEVQGIVAADFSLEGHENVVDIIKPLQKYVWIFLGLTILGMIVSGLQYLLYRLSQQRVYIDPLTGIYNRNFLNDMIKTLDFHKYAIAMLDLDKFKVINDTYGHNIGDEVLRNVAEALKSSIREEDKLIRYGGEEFILFLSMRDLTHDGLIAILQRLRRNVESLSIQTGRISISPTISIGLNSYASYFKNEHDAISMADKMLYDAKRTGRNKVVAYTPLKAVDEHSIHFLNVHHVKEAIEEKRLFCEYQPIVQLDTHKIVGHEALIRIRDRNGKVLYPGMFLPNIANSNVYKELTLELLRMNFQKVQNEYCYISINLNITDILDDDIYQAIFEQLFNTKGIAGYFTFELLEEEQITNLELLKERIGSIRSFGSKISIDDFGTGYSNFSHIFALDVDIIKIDGSLVKNIDSSVISRKLVESIVAFAEASHKKVVAEFIHSREILDIIKELNIAYGQGFYLGKPNESLTDTLSND